MTTEKRAGRGFTLIEIVITLAVVAVIAGIGIASLRAGQSQSAQGSALQQGKDLLLGVRDQAVASMECRRVEDTNPGVGNLSISVYRDVDCNPTTTAGDVLLQTFAFDPATTTQVKVEDNGNFDDERIQYKADGSLFDTDETRLRVVDQVGVHYLRVQLATGGVVLSDGS